MLLQFCGCLSQFEAAGAIPGILVHFYQHLSIFSEAPPAPGCDCPIPGTPMGLFPILTIFPHTNLSPPIPLSQPSLFNQIFLTLFEHFSVFSLYQELFLLSNMTFATLIPPCTMLNHSSLPKQPPKGFLFYFPLLSLLNVTPQTVELKVLVRIFMLKPLNKAI